MYFETNDLAVGYNGNALISDINISMKKGEILTLIGPNGAGKSTILKTITRHLERVAGVISIDRQNIRKWSNKELAKRLSVVLTERIEPELITCEQVVAMGRYPYTGHFGSLTPEDKRIVAESLGMVHAKELADRSFSDISDGQRQRIMLARAICQEPEIIVLDEPTSYLDIRHKIELLDILSRMASEKNVAVLMSLHEIDLAAKISDKIICVKGDKIEMYGTPEEVFSDERVRALYELEGGSFNTLFGSVELMAPAGDPDIFVLAGAGKGIPIYRRLQKNKKPFFTGILFENDVDLQVARVLAAQVVTAPAFTAIGEKEIAEAKRLIDRVHYVIDAGTPVGEQNKRYRELLEYAVSRGKKILTDAESEQSQYPEEAPAPAGCSQSVCAPRVLFAGVSSGCGKTTVTCAVLQALVNRGMKLHAFKCGPDYIDPMFHERVIGSKGSNLDPFFYDDNTMRYLLAKNAADAEVSILEGAMGYYDGSLQSMENSTYEAARVTRSSVVLVINGRGMAYSVTALLQGFLTAVPDSGIRGVILNHVSASAYKVLKEVIEKQFGNRIKVFGYLPERKDCSFESRHLGLITAAEIADIREKLNKLADAAEQCIDLDGLLALAKESEPLDFEPVIVPKAEMPVRIAVAMDKAFCFYYRDNLELLQEMGAELKLFSPLSDEKLPECDALYLGGGYPELYLKQLSGNKAMRSAVKQALEAGMPCIAECGGFMYLTEAIEGHPMVGVLRGSCENKGHLVRFGYITLTAKEDNLLCRAGEQIRAHEFHHYDAEDPGHFFLAQKEQGRSWDCGFAGKTLYAGYPHLPFYANPGFAESFYKAAEEFQRKNRSQELEE